MRAFACGTCRSLVLFENFRCVTCNSPFARNAVNRGTGYDAPVPFVLTPKVLERPRFEHVVVGAMR